MATAVVGALVGLFAGLIPEEWLTDHLVWWCPVLVALLVGGIVLWREPAWMQAHPWISGAVLGLMIFGPGVSSSQIAVREADRAIGLAIGVRRVSGAAGAQSGYSPVVQARAGDVLEFEVIASIGGARAEKGAGVRFILPKAPRAGHLVRADYLKKPGVFGQGDTLEIRPASGLVRLSAPTEIVARSEYGGTGDPAPPQPHFVAEYERPLDLLDDFVMLVTPDFLPRLGTYRQLAIRFRVRVTEG